MPYRQVAYPSRSTRRVDERVPTHDLVAYNLYLRGRYFWHRRTKTALLESVRFFEEAVARDSSAVWRFFIR